MICKYKRLGARGALHCLYVSVCVCVCGVTSWPKEGKRTHHQATSSPRPAPRASGPLGASVHPPLCDTRPLMACQRSVPFTASPRHTGATCACFFGPPPPPPANPRPASECDLFADASVQSGSSQRKTNTFVFGLRGFFFFSFL